MSAFHKGVRSQVALIGTVVLLLQGVTLATQGPQPWQWAVSMNLTEERVIGLLDLPEIVGYGCGANEPKSIDLHGTPSTSTPAIGSIGMLVTDRNADGTSCGSAELTVHRAASSSDEELPTEESGYEVRAAVVYERSGPWFRIALQRGSAWLHHERLDDFHSYPEVLKHGRAYIKQDWDGRLWRTAGTGTPTRIPAAWAKYLGRDISVEILGSRRVGNEIWIQLRLETETCGNTLQGVTPTTGWIPAYRSSGASVWFYSRGC